MTSATPPLAESKPKFDEESLYEVHKKVHPSAVSGIFATWRWALVWITQLIFYGLCWLPWNGRQAVLFDLVERKFYIFGLVFWPQDVFFLAILLIISAYSLFLFTAVAVACGAAMPVRRRCIRKSSPGSSRRSRASAMPESSSMRRR
jgi:hypothetical protein